MWLKFTKLVLSSNFSPSTKFDSLVLIVDTIFIVHLSPWFDMINVGLIELAALRATNPTPLFE
jgi:hypothetical protein